MENQEIHDWAVTFLFAAAMGQTALEHVEDALDALDATVAAVPPDRVTVTVHLQGRDPVEAVDAGRTLLKEMPEPLTRAELIGVEAISETEHDRRAEAPTIPELVGASEVGAMLHVSRQRVHQLRDHPAFPAPLVEVAMGPLWDARAVEAFARAWNRQPGRRRLAVAASR